MELIQSKSVLARLMAAENINISHQNVPTAYFDLQNRSLVLPMWGEMDGYMYDLLCGHEVGHALYTPFDGWHHNTHSNPAMKPFLNVIEDARIEKRIKSKFPGLAKSFAQAYADLYERDFFGIKKIDDLNTLNLIDRINLYFKLGAHVIVPFTDAERVFVRDTGNAETWDDVVDIANRVYAYVKQNESSKLNNVQDLMDKLADMLEDDLNDVESDGQSDVSMQSDDDESDDSQDDETDGTSDDSDESTDSDDTEESDAAGSAGDDEDSEDSEIPSDTTGMDGGVSNDNTQTEEPSSITDDIFRKRESELVSNGRGKVYMFDLPTPNLKNIIVPVETTLLKFEAEASRFNLEEMTRQSVSEFNSRNSKYIAMLVKEFEMRKNATEYARAQISRSGQLDTSKLHQFKLKNDLFKRVTTIGKGKSHAMQLVFDMSGSMYDIFKETVEQILVLSVFCKRVNIPFEVYGFTDVNRLNRKGGQRWARNGGESEAARNAKPTMYGDPNFSLIKFLSSDMSAGTYRRAFNMLTIVAAKYNKHSNYFGAAMAWDKAGFELGGTPLAETMITMRTLAEQFKHRTGVDHVNLVIMTDGEGHYNNVSHSFDYRQDSVYVVDPQNKERQKVIGGHHYINEAVEKLVHKSLSQQGIKVIGYYIAKQARNLVYACRSTNLSVMKAAIKKQGFYVDSNRSGFDKYFLLPIGEAQAETMGDVDATNKNALRNAFKQMQKGKQANRALATNFAKEIAL
jgi:cobalamin biosynthesis protein CobT